MPNDCLDVFAETLLKSPVLGGGNGSLPVYRQRNNLNELGGGALKREAPNV